WAAPWDVRSCAACWGRYWAEAAGEGRGSNFHLALRLHRWYLWRSLPTHAHPSADAHLSETNAADAGASSRLLTPGISIAEAEDRNRPKRVMDFRDLLLFYVVTGISLRWIATAASAGPSSIVIWITAWLSFYTPLALSVLELSSRYPNEGG